MGHLTLRIRWQRSQELYTLNYAELLNNSCGTSGYQLALVSEKPNHRTAADDNAAEQQGQEHIVYSSILGQATDVWDEETGRWHAKPRRLVVLRIPDLNQRLAECWQYNAGSNLHLFDPPYLLHVGQDRESPEGNCLGYHKRNGEQPCSSWDKCKQHQKDRRLQEYEDHKQRRERRNRRLAAKKEGSL